MMSTEPIVLNKRLMPVATGVYVGRPSKWGNPFIVGVDGDRARVIEKYEHWLTDNYTLMRDLPELLGRNLICWCAPLPCHADVLLRLANR